MEEKKDYSSTLNLPKTEFEMRGNLQQKSLKFWRILFQKKFII